MPALRSVLGQRGEQLARNFLEAQGYQILAANYRCRWGEIDLVARQGSELVFVEVRTRRSLDYGTPEESITGAKARRLAATAQDYLQLYPNGDAAWRIDLIAIRLGSGYRGESVQHLHHAIQL